MIISKKMNKKQKKMQSMTAHNILSMLAEIYGGIKIALSPILLLSGSGFVIYYNFQTTLTFILFIIFSICGCILGFLLARNKWKNGGTIQFLSRIMATPELDDIKEKHEDRN